MNEKRKSLSQAMRDADAFVIAEVGMNHDGSLGNALRLIEEAADAGVDAVKFQLHISAAETLPNAPTPPYFKVEGRYQYFERTAFSLEEWTTLREHATELGLYFVVSPFSRAAVDVLEAVGVDGYKVASGETTNLPLLEYLRGTGKATLLSTGMSNWAEVDAAVDALGDSLAVVFQCSSSYPCPPERVGFNVVEELAERYDGVLVGFSDHTLSSASAVAALLKGATVFEKHFTLSKRMYGADARFSLEPEELAEFVSGLRFVARALASPVDKDDLEPYEEMKRVFEKSVVAARDLPVGHELKLEDLAFKKPGDGIRADRYRTLLGRRLKVALKVDQQVLLSHLEPAIPSDSDESD
ncbi:MAG: N-acetylneuraminate synthase [Promethearchaeota archaeon]